LIKNWLWIHNEYARWAIQKIQQRRLQSKRLQASMDVGFFGNSEFGLIHILPGDVNQWKPCPVGLYGCLY
jgi:hypothetical protein